MAHVRKQKIIKNKKNLLKQQNNNDNNKTNKDLFPKQTIFIFFVGVYDK